jgi:hypothetical protein
VLRIVSIDTEGTPHDYRCRRRRFLHRYPVLRLGGRMSASDILSIISLVVAASSLVMNFYLHIEASRLRKHIKEVETRFHDLEFELEQL